VIRRLEGSGTGLQLTELGIATAQALAKESFPIGPIGKTEKWQ